MTFECDYDFELKGKATITCSYGTWADDIPQCKGTEWQIMFTDLQDDDDDGDDDYDDDDDDDDDDDKYNLYYLISVITCPDPGSPKHGRQTKVSNNFAVGGFVRFKCDENYILTGKGKLTCQRDKKWNGNLPKCLGKSVNIRMSIAKLSLTQMCMWSSLKGDSLL